MWNLIVSADETAWEGEQRMKMLRGRFGEYSGDESTAVDLANPESRKFLEQVHTVLMYEVGVSDPPGDMVRIGHLRDIQADHAGHPLRDITFRFREKGRITHSWMEENPQAGERPVGVWPHALGREGRRASAGHAPGDVGDSRSVRRGGVVRR